MISHEQKKDILIRKYMRSAEFEDKINELKEAIKTSEEKKIKDTDDQILLI